jgi:hypothetical protein
VSDYNWVMVGGFIRAAVPGGFRQGPSAPQAALAQTRAQEKTACSGREDSGEKEGLGAAPELAREDRKEG